MDGDVVQPARAQLEAVKKFIGVSAVNHARSLSMVSAGIVSISFPEGVIYANVDENCEVKITLPRWASALGWELTDD